MNFLSSIFTKPSVFKAPEQTVTFINDLKGSFRNCSDSQLKEKALKITHEVRAGETLESKIVEFFAIVREASKRILSLFAYEEQLLAGIVLAEGSIAEIATGEGKTLIAVFPISLHALKGKRVHMVTVNAYLSERDYKEISPLYEFLGFSTSLLTAEDPPNEKHIKYQKDIAFGTGYQFGFDYLREQLRLLNEEASTLGHSYREKLFGRNKRNKNFFIHQFADFVLVDEVDSVLLDEAHMPLVIAGITEGPHPNPHIFLKAKSLAASLEKDDYKLNMETMQLYLTPNGKEKVYQFSEHINLKGLKRPFHLYVEAALKAQLIFKKDIHYVIEDDSIAIVDQNTGRPFKERTWKDGLHQAVQAKENITVTQENETLASITRQKYFNFYPILSGMTGTAEENKKEFKETYGMGFKRIPLHKASKQVIYPTNVFNTWENVLNAVVEAIENIHSQGRPILIGTRSIVASEHVAERLKQLYLKFKLLNAKQNANEAEIIKEAGQKGAITIATNMAGRGTHIPIDEEVAALGGLHVLALERNESPRIDRQLTGRTARQGLPGSAQFFLSGEDYILRRYKPHLVKKLSSFKSDSAGKLPTETINFFDETQKAIEIESYYLRKRLMAQDKWVESVKEKL